MVRGRGYVGSIEDLELAPLLVSESGAPVYIKDVAEVRLGPDVSRGLAELDGEGEVVGGIVVMRYGENALRVIETVKERLEEIGRGLPEGVELVVTYDRSDLIEASIDTLRETLLEEMMVVSVVIFLFLMHARSALIPIITLPLGVLFSFIPMYYQGLTINIMSLGGIAVAIGAMVDAAIIIIENVHKKLETEDLTDRALEMVRDHVQVATGRPFFLYVPYTAPHIPIAEPKEWQERNAHIADPMMLFVTFSGSIVMPRLGNSSSAGGPLKSP